MSEICRDRVAIITGAGSGLGRSYALALAAEGAAVVVNDINRASAAAVVAEIQAAGGRAQVNDSDITGYDDSARAVSEAITAFGGLHVVINNAGICRDRMFINMTEEEWDAVVAVHLKGHFCISNHACHHWREQSKAGAPVAARIINTSSGAGLQGSVGQANYSAAKGGIASLTLVQAVELARYGITVNALAPSARTGMTEGPFAEMMKPPEQGFDYYHPDNVAPLVVWLASEASSQVTGRLFEVEGGMIALEEGWRIGPEQRQDARFKPTEAGAAALEAIASARPPQKVYGT